MSRMELVGLVIIMCYDCRFQVPGFWELVKKVFGEGVGR